MKKFASVLSGIALFLIALSVSVYFLLAEYYKNGFSFNTWINGVYCTGKTVSEINDDLKGRYETRSIEIINPDGTVEYILPDEINYRIDFTQYLNSILESQDPYKWYENFNNNYENLDISPDFSYDEYALTDKISNLSIVKQNKKKNNYEVEIRKGDNGFYLYDSYTPYINIDMLTDTITKGLYSDSDSIELSTDYLIYPEYSSKDLAIIKEWETVREEFLLPRLTLDMGTEQILIDEKILSEFIELGDDGCFIRDEEGKLLIHEDKVLSFIEELMDSYDTYGKDRIFTTVKGEEIIIKNVYYGTLLNHKIESKYFLDAIKNGVSEVHTPEYIKKGYVRGLDDIGNTYIEVDMNEQVLYFFQDGVINLNCDIVSGKPPVYSTPQMICFVYSKKKNAILRGPGYASPVDYWMAIYGGIGLHDASWQKAFGKDRYIRYGSHGCINMKLRDVEYLYETTEIGIPVILYY